MSITPDPGGTLPREETTTRGTSQRQVPPPPPPPPPQYGYAPPPQAPQQYAPPQQAYAPPPPPQQTYAPPPQNYAPPQPSYVAPPAQPTYSYGSPSAPEQTYGGYPPPESGAISTAKWFGPVMIAAVVLLAGGLFFIAHDMGTKNDALKLQLSDLQQTTLALKSQLENVNAKNSQLKEQLGSTAETFSKKLGATQAAVNETKKSTAQLEEEQRAAAENQKQTATQLGQAIEGVRAESASKISAVNTDVGGVKKDVDATKKDLDATKAQLKSAIGDLGVQSGLIARNHDELEALKRRNERNYFEFNITKTKVPSKVGDIGLKLTKTDPKKGKYTIEVLADDKTVEKKDRGANEVLQFYVARNRGIPYEIVVNQVDKDRIVGYLATPK